MWSGTHPDNSTLANSRAPQKQDRLSGCQAGLQQAPVPTSTAQQSCDGTSTVTDPDNSDNSHKCRVGYTGTKLLPSCQCTHPNRVTPASNARPGVNIAKHSSRVLTCRCQVLAPLCHRLVAGGHEGKAAPQTPNEQSRRRACMVSTSQQVRMEHHRPDVSTAWQYPSWYMQAH